jgi:enoyl-CoA hydratase
MEKLFIAALNGITLGGALELALACDLRVAAANAVFGLPEINFGLIPDAGGTIRLTRLIGPGAAKELILSGKFIPSDDAKSMGLIQRIFAAENFMEEVAEYSKPFEQKSPIALGLGKFAVNKNVHQDIGSGLEDALFIQSILLETREHREALDDYTKELKLKHKQ